MQGFQLSPLSTGSLSVVQNVLDNFHNGKTTKMNGGGKQLCVICGGLANGYHFGALSCAACNAFFRRSVAESRKYFCRKSGHCVIDQAARCFCRACRLKKCLDCGMDPNVVQKPEVRSALPRSDYDSSRNIVELLVESYRRLRERRRLLFCPPTLRDLLGGTEAVRTFIAHNGDRENNSLIVNIMLVKNAGVPYSLMEKFYVTMRGGGFQTHRIINNDNTADTLSRSEDLVATSKVMKADVCTAKRLLLFTFLCVVWLFSTAAPNLSDLAKKLVKEARDHLYLDWFAYYEAHNISDGSMRVGNALLLLPAIYVCSKKQLENYHLVRFFNLFELTSLVDDLKSSVVAFTKPL
ncbi:unnamed protein product [Enterobius vermicularis]|uniref:Nuclear receptor domain-containing protein n=1 Tax=Enterobius vermicularis TaxID=51028 RepID=A0A0N4VB85_ENTVE|nr:unnamed protein product [Enterobius vermicularis]